MFKFSMYVRLEVTYTIKLLSCMGDLSSRCNSGTRGLSGLLLETMCVHLTCFTCHTVISLYLKE